MWEVVLGLFYLYVYLNGWVLQIVQYCIDIRLDYQRLLFVYEDDGSSSSGSCDSVIVYWFVV